MRRTFLIASVPALLGAIAAGALATGRYNFHVLMGSILLAIYTLPFAALAVAVILWLRKRQEARPAWREHLGGALAAWCLFIFLLGPAWLVGSEVLEWRVEQAKEQAEGTIAALEEHRSRHGRYPEDVALPALIEKHGAYQVSEDGQTYELWFTDPGSLFDSWFYDPKTSEWRIGD
ncbi:MAG: hypothetical protein ACYTDY_07750 [Planctomycetota bacterium]